MIRNALQSKGSMVGLLFLVAVLLLLPVAVAWLGLPPRIEAYRSISTEAGTAGAVVQAIYQSPRQADVVFLGSSLVTAGISKDDVRAALGQHLHRDVSVQALAMNWPGLDVQYFMLRDYLVTHHARLIVWNLPEPHVRAYDHPHVQAYRWLRWGEYSDALNGLSLQQRFALYGDMVIGAPRQLLSAVRPNHFDGEGVTLAPSLTRSGYMGRQFVSSDVSPASGDDALLFSLDNPAIVVRGPAPGPYQMHFAGLVIELARKHNCGIVLLHIPIDAEFGDREVPELADWKAQFGPGFKMIAVPSATLFAGMNRSQFDLFYRDAHLNDNGNRYFTQALLPALFQAFDEAEPNRR